MSKLSLRSLHKSHLFAPIRVLFGFIRVEIFLLFILTLIGAYLRFTNLNWGEPWWFHPDERNIASAVTRLSWPYNMDPDFFAYGTVPIYLNFFLVKAAQHWLSVTEDPFFTAIKVGRIISALLSTALIPLMYWITQRYFSPINKSTLNPKPSTLIPLLSATLTTFSFGFIQFAHFGTFEIWLTFLRLLLFVVALELARNPTWKWITWAALLLGLAVGTKVTSLVLLPALCFALFWWLIKQTVHPSHLEKYDAIVVLGKSLSSSGKPSVELKNRVSHALKLYQQGLAPQLIFSGGSGHRLSDSASSEAQAMQEMALKAGVKPSHLTLEARSHTTMGNAQAVTKLIKQADYQSILVVTSDYHLAWSLLAFWACGIAAYGSSIPAGSIINWVWETILLLINLPRIIFHKTRTLLAPLSLSPAYFQSPVPAFVNRLFSLILKSSALILASSVIFFVTNPFTLRALLPLDKGGNPPPPPAVHPQPSSEAYTLLHPLELIKSAEDNLNPAFAYSIGIEGDIARGTISTFYTRHFINTIPYLYQFTHVYPWILSWPVLILGLLGLILSLRTPKPSPSLLPASSLLVIFFLLQFGFIGQLYVKWTRYTIPTLPYLIFAAVWILIALQQWNNETMKQLNKRLKIYPLFLLIIIGWQVIQGLSLFSVYLQPDPRIQAAQWAVQHIPQNSRIISEVWDLGIIPFNPRFMSHITLFNFYELDQSSDESLPPETSISYQRQQELAATLPQTAVIVLLSRRLWKHTLDHPDQFPQAAKFYQQLFSGDLGFTKVADFYNAPRIGPFAITDEALAEETFSVFDHPHLQIWMRDTLDQPAN